MAKVRSFDSATELMYMYAARACKEARLMLRPPYEQGKEAFSQAQSERGLLVKSTSASRRALSKAEIACWIWLGGQHLREKEIFGRERQDLRRVVAI